MVGGQSEASSNGPTVSPVPSSSPQHSDDGADRSAGVRPVGQKTVRNGLNLPANLLSA